jgi:phosphomannomutase
VLDRRGWSQVLPDPDEPVVHIYAEGKTRESSNELAEELRKLVDEIMEGAESEARVSS